MSKTISTSVYTEELSQSLSFLWLLLVCVVVWVRAFFVSVPLPSLTLSPRIPPSHRPLTVVVHSSHRSPFFFVKLESTKGWKNLGTECAAVHHTGEKLSLVFLFYTGSRAIAAIDKARGEWLPTFFSAILYDAGWKFPLFAALSEASLIFRTYMFFFK